MQQNRLSLARARHDTHDWVQERRARTRQLIELGGLVHKAGLVELLDDDHATLLGALLDIAGRLQPQEGGRQEGRTETPVDLKARWRHRGLRAFDADVAALGSCKPTNAGLYSPDFGHIDKGGKNES